MDGPRGRWIPLVYYYLATIVGLAILLVGLIGGLQSLVDAIFPETSDELLYNEPLRESDGRFGRPTAEERAEARELAIERAQRRGVGGAIDGGIAVIVGVPVFWWHLRQARRKEPEWFAATSAGQADQPRLS